ncbi:MAG TPA: diheme cytochrome c-553 [Acidobacteriota bacterium]
MRIQQFIFVVFGAVLIAVFLVPLTTTLRAQKAEPATMSQVERGRYLAHIGACHDCHSPKVFTDKGPVPDESRLLSGHPSNDKVPPVPAGTIGPNGWGAMANNHFTAWAGPWGVSFTANLTADPETGLGSWTEDMFMKAIRTGKHMGEGRDILPPMPWPEYRNFTDDDLKAIFAYLRTLKPIKNAVPDPIPPTATQ